VSEDDTKRIMSQVFMATGLMIAAMFLAFLLSWAYNKEKTLFIAMYAVISLLFSALVITLVSILRDKIEDMKIFYTLVGSTAFMSLFNIVMIIVFAVIASKRLRRSFVPNGVQEYINQ
jgi:ABC-type Mn2+/Zn2+ transport system permease subunit